MKTIIILSLLAATGLSAPFELLSKRPLGDHEWTRRDDDGCPGLLTPGEFEFPHYITQISASEPDRAFGPSYFGEFTPGDVSSIFSFDIPEDRADYMCTLEFLFPRQEQLRTSSYSYSGGGNFVFTGYNASDCPGPETTFNNQPALGPYPAFPPVHMEPGYAYVIDIGPCFVSAGTCVAGKTSTDDTHFSFFQDYDDCPIGLYTTYSKS